MSWLSRTVRDPGEILQRATDHPNPGFPKERAELADRLEIWKSDSEDADHGKPDFVEYRLVRDGGEVIGSRVVLT